jgi:hypothetical protein
VLFGGRLTATAPSSFENGKAVIDRGQSVGREERGERREERGERREERGEQHGCCFHS